ncbi:P-loop containing nucleoside triphosphate hydrolase protein [Violaceomyces palustris]|uniref:P-loop containing nucleoside triphosphate hydrolase protein n=1 Tax=Violaceomyces palustris TaxID=1673888 RepID=A0ACD0P524_9BASI|nr:P-loop containing nucleoside triphosphate hydrolase protein [Violaceomyces palustris]
MNGIHPPPNDSDQDPQPSPAASATSAVASTSSLKNPLHVEVRLKVRSTARLDSIKKYVKDFIEANYCNLECESDLVGWKGSPFLADHVDSIRIAESSAGLETIAIESCNIEIHAYQPTASDEVEEYSAADPDGEDADDVMAATVAELPSRALDGVWDSLVYADDIKVRLLNYIYTTLLFSDANVDFNIVSWNRVVLLHGPPGTGKTSLCRALAQKLAIRLSDRYTHGKLVEINSHSLFSKWFSESGKLVQRLFSMVTELVEDEDGFVVILIDEVESLTAARSAAAAGTEPSDAVRVVNALLTQLDKLKHRKNVLVMTTSNISESIDTAFIDRADIKQYIGLPPPEAVYWILKTCLGELTRVGLVAPTTILDCKAAKLLHAGIGVNEGDESKTASSSLWKLANMCSGISGRTLRKLPVLAHARHIGLAAAPVPCGVWLDAMHKALDETREELAKALGGSSV